jgi:hypothetical protein
MADSFRDCLSKLLTIIFDFLSLCGCQQNAIQLSKDNETVRRALCEIKGTMIIGFRTGEGYVQLDSCNADINTSIAYTASTNQLKSYSNDETESPDHLWTLRQSSQSIVAQRKSDWKQSVLIQTLKIVSPPRWSPDSKWFFYVTSEDRNRKRSLGNCFDDAYDLHIVNVSVGSQALVGRVCAGIPYLNFHWLNR